MPKIKEIASCDLASQQKLAMQQSIAEMREFQAAGIPVSGKLFGKIIRDSWKKIKEEAAKTCPEMSLAEARKKLKAATGK